MQSRVFGNAKHPTEIDSDEIIELESIFGVKAKGKLIKAYNNIYIFETIQGERMVVHKEDVNKVRGGRNKELPKNKDMFDLIATKKMKRNPIDTDMRRQRKL